MALLCFFVSLSPELTRECSETAKLDRERCFQNDKYSLFYTVCDAASVDVKFPKVAAAQELKPGTFLLQGDDANHLQLSVETYEPNKLFC